MSKTLNPPRGYRFLAVGEVVQAGDKCYFRSRWETVDQHEVGHVISPYSFRRATPLVRPAAKPLRKTSIKKGGAS